MNDPSKSTDEPLIRAGLVPVSDSSPPKVPPFDAWKLVIGIDDIPDVVVAEDDPDYFEKAEGAWREVATREHLLDGDGSFWVHVADDDAMKQGWRKVRVSRHTEMAKNLGRYPGEPEFITMDIDERVVCAVTTEEEGIWIISARIGGK